MATAEAAVCNVALLRIGQTQFIESLNDPTNIGKVCKASFLFSRDQLLQARPWPFATLRQTLAVLADDEDDDEARSGWAFTYALPSDCIAPRYLWAGVDNPSKEEVVPFRIESSRDLQARVLLSNLEDAELIYTARVTEVSRWDPLFSEALAMKVASDLAFGIAKKPALGAELLKGYYLTLGIAHASAANQNTQSTQPLSEFELGRR